MVAKLYINNENGFLECFVNFSCCISFSDIIQQKRAIQKE